ncbi:unnamed protein product [Blepharisma stoltei]|uniref:Uncharacterized protein n=1 Tax=Blepharisma stoltei TaxID=1481888 RepID=A0AAU9IIW6_9CILI|nr:unnamed protein product [Blepharisma stoltei]
MRSKSTSLSQIAMHGNEKPVSKTININQMHLNSYQSVGVIGIDDMRNFKNFEVRYFPKIMSQNSTPTWPYIMPRPNLLQNNADNLPIQLAVSKSEQAVSLFKSSKKNRKISLPNIKSKGSLFKEMFNEENKAIERSLYFSRKPRFVDFKPYGLEDFKKISQKNCKMLGGLGPVNVGRDDWIKSTKKMKIVRDYSKSVRDLNINGDIDNINN